MSRFRALGQTGTGLVGRLAVLLGLLLVAQQASAQTRITSPPATFPTADFRCISNEPVGNLILNVTTNLIDCRDRCRTTNGCKYYTIENGTWCSLFLNCERLLSKPNSTTYEIPLDQTYAPVLWPAPTNYFCIDKWRVTYVTATNITACQTACNNRADCNFYSHFSANNQCSMYKTCPEIKRTDQTVVTRAKGANPTTCLTPPPMPPGYTQNGVHLTYYPYAGPRSAYTSNSSAPYWPTVPAPTLALTRIEPMFHYAPTSQSCGTPYCNNFYTYGITPVTYMDSRYGPVFDALATNSTYNVFGRVLTGAPNSQANNMMMQARVMIPCSGVYGFGLLGWDDSALVYLGNMTSPYINYTAWSSGYSNLGYGANVTLTAGQLLPIKLMLTNWAGGTTVRLLWKPPGYLEYTNIPTNFLLPGVGPDINVFPSAINSAPNATLPQQVCFNLTDPPGAEVTLSIGNSYGDIFAFDRCTVTISPTNWSTPQCVNAVRRPSATVYTGTILFPVTSTSKDGAYNGLKTAIQGYTQTPAVASGASPAYNSCIAWGDVHMVTFDNRLYDYMEMGMNTVLRDCAGDLVVQTNLYHCYTWKYKGVVTCNQNIYVKIGPAIYIASMEYSNGVPKVVLTRGNTAANPSVSVEQATPESVNLIFAEGTINIKNVRWALANVTYLNVKISLSPAWANKVSGLCGNYNQNKADDFYNVQTTEVNVRVPPGQELWRGDAAISAIIPLSGSCPSTPFSNTTIARPGGIVPDMQCSNPRPSPNSFTAVFNPPFVAPTQPADPPTFLEPITNSSIFADDPRGPTVLAACATGFNTQTCPGLEQETIDGMAAHCAFDAFAFDPNGTMTATELAQKNELTALCEQQKCSACRFGQTCVNNSCVNTTDVCGGGCANGGTCLATGQCMCVAPYSGTYCQTVPQTSVSPCAQTPSPCLSGQSTCSAVGSNYTCTCQAGYTGNGVTTCTDINECASGTHACSSRGTCTNTAGSYTCACNTGYTLMGPTSCVDTDECTPSTNPCPSNGYCTNTEGSFLCACKPGYTLGSNNTCQDIDECSTGTHTCTVNATCTNTDGWFECNCKDGYEGDGVTCTAIPSWPTQTIQSTNVTFTPRNDTAIRPPALNLSSLATGESVCCRRKSLGDMLARSVAIRTYTLECSAYNCASSGGAHKPNAPTTCPNTGCTFDMCCAGSSCESVGFQCAGGQMMNPLATGKVCPATGCTSAFCCQGMPSCDDRGYQLVNGDFEYPKIARTPPGSQLVTVASNTMIGWATTGAEYEIWSAGYLNTSSYQGYQFAEVNAQTDSELTQNINTVPGDQLIFEFSHRGREGSDTLEVFIGPVGNVTTSLGKFTTDNTAWKRYNASYVVPEEVYAVTIRFKAISAAGACGVTCGNLIDSVVLRPQRCMAVYTQQPCSNITFQLQNGDFEMPVVPRLSSNAPISSFLPTIPAWKTTDTVFEFWQSGFGGVSAYRGNQFAEVNANIAGTLYQDFTQVPTTELTFSFSHRGRSGSDTLRVLIGPKGRANEVLGEFTTGNTAWARYSVKWVVPEGVRDITIAFRAVSSASGRLSNGNFIDAIDVRPTSCMPVFNPSDCTTPTRNFQNGDFEAPILGAGNQFQYFSPSWVPGWKTTDTSFEFCKTGLLSMTAYKGNQWAEISAYNISSALYQYIDTTPGDEIEFSFSHRGRTGLDTLEVFAGPEMAGAVNVTLNTSLGQFVTDKTVWKRYTTFYIVPPGQNRTGFRFRAISSACPGPCGNFVDDVVVRPRRCA